MSFVHLHVRSAFSFLFGASQPAALAERAGFLGLPALALTDRAGLYGVVRFTKAARRAGVRPIIGCELPLANGSFLVLLVEDGQGYANLCRLITTAHLSRPRGFPAASLEQLDVFRQGLVCLTGGRAGQLWRLAQAGEEARASRWLARLKDIFGGSLYVEVIDHGLPGDREAGKLLASLAARAGVPAVAANDVAFAEPSGFAVHRALVGIQRAVHHRRPEPAPNEQAYLKSASEMAALHPPELVAASLEVAERCQGFELPLGRLRPPRYLGLPPDQSPQARLARLCFGLLPRRYGLPVPPRAIRALEHELGVIGRKRLADYFLIVRDIVEFARGRKIPVTVRGSAVGSVVTYLLCGGVDPLAQGLLFERFLNEDRQDMPDIDLDFDSERRDEVSAYVLERYGLERSAMVATVPTFRARSAVRELAASRGYPRERIEELAAFLPYYLRGSQIGEALEVLPELKGSELAGEGELLGIAAQLDGAARNLSVHLGGLVIADDLLSVAPVELSAKGFPVVQFDKDDVAALGLVKLDLLGLRMHTAIAKTIASLSSRGVRVDLDRLPLEDAATYELLRSTDTVGIFQVESPGQRQLLGRLQPERFADLIVEISLFRPGPMQADMITPYLARRQGRQPVAYLHPALAPVLGETNGVIVYQEQVLRIAHHLAGYSYGQADLLRRAMTKLRGAGEMERLRGDFIRRCLARGVSLEVAEEVWRGVAAFAGFGFCKAHAASFAYITFQSAYLKAHWPLDFYVGLLNAGRVGTYPPSVFVNEARRRGFQLFGPHVNLSGSRFLVEDEGIRVPLGLVSGLGPRYLERILAARRVRPFSSRRDFVRRTRLPRQVLAALFEAGAFGELPLAGPGEARP